MAAPASVPFARSVGAGLSAPSASTTMRSAMRTVEKRCEISRAILPAVRSEKRWKTSYSAMASSAAVGSSRMMICAPRMNARASATGP